MYLVVVATSIMFGEMSVLGRHKERSAAIEQMRDFVDEHPEQRTSVAVVEVVATWSGTRWSWELEA